MKMPKRWKSIAVWSVIGLTAFAVGLYFRLYPLQSSMWSANSDKAAVYVVTELKDRIRDQIKVQQPDMPKAQVNALVERKFNEIIRTDKKQLLDAIDRVSRSMDAEADQDAKAYLLASDSYYYYGLTKTVLKTGHLSEKVRGSKYFHPLMSAPAGQWEPLNMHPWVGAIVYKVALLFNPQISVMEGVALTPLILSVFILAAFLWCCRILNCHPLAAWIASIFFLLAPVFIKRGSYGWFDNDAYNLFFPLLLLGLFSAVVERRKERKSVLILCIAMAFCFTLYALFWHGWAFTFAILLASSIGMMILLWLFGDRSWPGALLAFVTLAVATLVGVSCIFGFRDFFLLFAEGLGELKKFTVREIAIWPSLFIGVGELHAGSVDKILEMIGSWLFLSVGIAGGGIALVRALLRRELDYAIKLAAFLLFLAVATVLTLKAQRFILLCLAPLAVAFAVGIDLIVRTIRGLLPQRWQSPKIIWIFYLPLCALIAIPIVHTHKNIRATLNPIFNATWEQALIRIKESTPENSVINAWWPPGHFIKAVAERRVTFDGASLSNTIQGYFIASAYLSSDERHAAGLLRMLNVSGDKAVKYLTGEGLETSQAVSILHYIASKTRAEAADFLKMALSPKQIETLLAMTHADPPPTYLLIYNELIEKNLGLAWHAKWNFKQLEEVNRNPELRAKVPPTESSRYIQFLWDTMGGPYKFSEIFNALSNEGPKIIFEEGIGVNLQGMTAAVQSKTYGRGIPRLIVYSDGHQVIEKPMPNGNLNYALVLVQDRGRYQVILMDDAMARSMLVRLYFFKAQGLSLFKPAIMEEDVAGRTRIQVFEVNAAP